MSFNRQEKFRDMANSGCYDKAKQHFSQDFSETVLKLLRFYFIDFVME